MPDRVDPILEVVRRTFGYDGLRPLQAEAIGAALDGRDALVVLPTGGGKSLCYQVPPLVAARTDVVVSPLISLMKDQVDGLRELGYPAAALHSGQDARERRRAEAALREGSCRLLLVSPERAVTAEFLSLARRLGVRSFAIDEAHCISHWGHAFRPEYRQLAVLKTQFPGAGVQAYTATATRRVQEDIARQLGLQSPLVLVGPVDRPNLAYRVIPRLRAREQVLEVLARHPGQAAIVYCISRDETERLAGQLAERGLRARCYHAGLEPHTRREAQEAFAKEEIDVMVATVAFGMGIDRSDVRCVIHTAMPKSLEHYQQETGRAGRDGLEAECVLLFSPGDVLKWEGLIKKGEDGADEGELERARALLLPMRRYCAPGRCRHRLLSEHFDQTYQGDDCGACDVCLGECENLVDGTDAARKILSCVARVRESYGIGHVAEILKGSAGERLNALGHDQLSTFGLLRELPKAEIIQMIYQLIDQGLLGREGQEYPVLHLNAASWQVMRGQREVQLLPPRQRRKERPLARSRAEVQTWEGVERGLFEHLRAMRLSLSRERGVAPYMIFSDATLRDMARRRPRSPESFLAVHGVGAKKLKDLGPAFLEGIRAWSDTARHGPAEA